MVSAALPKVTVVNAASVMEFVTTNAELEGKAVTIVVVSVYRVVFCRDTGQLISVDMLQ